MKKSIFILLLSCLLFIPSAYAKDRLTDGFTQRCLYTYDSNQYGSSSVEIHIYPDNTAYAWITRMNNDTHENDEKVMNWDVNTYVSMGKKCPPYVVANTSAAAEVYAFYNENEASTQYNKYTSQPEESHVFASTTSEADFSVSASSVYALNKDYNSQVDSQIQQSRDRVQSEASEKITGDWNDDYSHDYHVGDKFCGEPRVVQALKALGVIIVIARFLVPIIVIVIGSKDFVSAVLSGESSTLRTSAKKLGLRVVIGLFVFFIPALAHAFLSGLSHYNLISDDINQCQNCLLDPFNEAYCIVDGDAAGSTPNRNNVDSQNVDTTRNANADGELGDTTPDVNAGQTGTNTPSVNAGQTGTNTPSVNAGSTGTNTPSVNAGQTGTNTPSVNAGSTGTNTPGVNAGKTGTNTPSVNAGQTGNNTPIVIIDDPKNENTVVVN
jgi:hypothetical protein